MTESPSLPIFIVEGANWTVEVELDEHAIEGLDLMGQILEASTRACEMILRYRHPEEEKQEVRPRHESFILAEGQTKPFVGALIFVHPKGEDPNRAQAMIPAFIPLADAGFYMDSMEAHKVLQLEDKEGAFLKIAMRIMFGDEMNKRAEQNEADVKNLEQLQADLNKSETQPKDEKPKPDLGPVKPKPKKPIKPKPPTPPDDDPDAIL